MCYVLMIVRLPYKRKIYISTMNIIKFNVKCLIEAEIERICKRGTWRRTRRDRGRANYNLKRLREKKIYFQHNS